jgi:hypothetical protein
MTRIMQVIPPTALLLSSIMFCAANTRAQACGGAFAEVTISDSKGRRIPDVTIELIAAVPQETYYEKYRDGTAAKISEWNGAAYEISTQEAEGIVKLRSPMLKTKDFCENPFKQRFNSTKVKSYYTASLMNFGFCTSETYSYPYLLKIFAPGYATKYYAGPFLGGCRRTYKIVLTKEK